nr:acyltransferase family protein [uncultured Treponema sp.]
MDGSLTKRIGWIDIAKGIAIISVILGHSVGKGPFGIFIYSFHIPLFFVLSGYTIKRIPATEIPGATLRDFKRLIIPIFICFLIDAILQVFYLGNNIDEVIKYKIRAIVFGTLHKGMGRLWFLVALFWTKLFYRILLLKDCKYKIIFLLVCAYLCSINQIQLPQNLDIMFIMLFFMEVGYIYKNSIDEYNNKIEIIGIVSFFVWTYLIWYRQVYLDIAVRLYPPLSILGAVCGSLCVIQFSKFLSYNTIMNKVWGGRTIVIIFTLYPLFKCIFY